MNQESFVYELDKRHRNISYREHRPHGTSTGAIEFLVADAGIGDDCRWPPGNVVGKIIVFAEPERWEHVAEVFGITPYNPEDEKRRDAVFENALRVAVVEMSGKLMQQREQILEAFVAETGCLPSECEQVMQVNGTQIRWRVQKRSP